MAFRIEHRLGIPAPPRAVWEVLGELERWPEWQQLYPDVKGSLRIGGRLEVTEALIGAPRPLAPSIIDWVPEDQIHWRVKGPAGLITRVRYFEIEKLTDSGLIFSNGELYEGFATRYVPRTRRKALRDAFAAFGEALKSEVLRRA